jgi:hypothetical protein
MRKTAVLIALSAVLILFAACAKKPESAANTGRQATVSLKSGSTVTGTVLDSSATEIKLSGDDNITRTIPMSEVRSVEYSDAAAPAPSSAPAASTSAPAPAPASAAAPAKRNSALPPKPAEPIARPSESAITTKTYELPSGSTLSVRVEDTIDSANSAEGQAYPATITEDAKDAQGNVVIPRGAAAKIEIVSATPGGKIKGSSDLRLDLQSVTVGGRRYVLSTTDLEQKGKSGVGANKRTATFTGGGAALGAIIGAIAGGGKGAAIGAGAGAGAGALTQVLTRGSSIKVPVESVLTFKLDKPLRVVAE